MRSLSVPASMRKFAGDSATIQLDGQTLAELLKSLRTTAPELASKVLDENDQPHAFVQLYVDGRSTRDQPPETEIAENAELLLIAPVAGG